MSDNRSAGIDGREPGHLGVDVAPRSASRRPPRRWPPVRPAHRHLLPRRSSALEPRRGARAVRTRESQVPPQGPCTAATGRSDSHVLPGRGGNGRRNSGSSCSGGRRPAPRRRQPRPRRRPSAARSPPSAASTPSKRSPAITASRRPRSSHRSDRSEASANTRPALCRAPLTTSPVADRPGGPPHPRLVGDGADAPSAPSRCGKRGQ